MEIEKAIQYLKIMRADTNNLNKIGYAYGTEAIEIVLQALDKNEKIIDLMLDDLDTKGFGKEEIYNSYKYRVKKHIKR